MLILLANDPNIHFLSYIDYLINEFTFYTKKQIGQSTMQNSDVIIVSQTIRMSNVKDGNPIYVYMSYLDVDLNRPLYKDEHFILASQAQSLFNVDDPPDMKLSIVILDNKIIINNIDDQDHNELMLKMILSLRHYNRVSAVHLQIMIYVEESVMTREFG
ncbi:hypothetical protein Lal_00031917 [Lupinus albus]|nr:hypothetical protein Lal_00031917 [Lupinus albus]